MSLAKLTAFLTFPFRLAATRFMEETDKDIPPHKFENLIQKLQSWTKYHPELIVREWHDPHFPNFVNFFIKSNKQGNFLTLEVRFDVHDTELNAKNKGSETFYPLRFNDVPAAETEFDTQIQRIIEFKPPESAQKHRPF